MLFTGEIDIIKMSNGDIKPYKCLKVSPGEVDLNILFMNSIILTGEPE